MSYRRALLTRWSRRDRLAVLVVGVTAAFLVGSVVVLLAVSAQSTAIAAEFGATASVDLAGTDPDPPDATRYPVAVVSGPDGAEATVLGVPEGSTLLDAPAEGLAGPVGGATSGTFRGTDAALDLPVRPAEGRSVLPPSWYVADAATAERLGTTRTLVVGETTDPVPERGSPLMGALAFFLAGTRQVLALLGVVSVGAAVLVGVIVHSVTRMSVRDRRGAIRVLRATGATPRAVLALFAARAALITGVGLALGYAVGVVVPNAAVAVAISAGLPLGLDLAMSGRTALLVGGVLVGLLFVGTLAGTLAARPAATGPPAGSGERRSPGSRLPAWARPETLSARAFVPTTGALAVFVTFVLVLASLSGLLAGIGAAGGGAVTEPGAPHPVASTVDEGYADALRAAGREASPEVLLFLVVDGHPFPARGVQFDAYRAFEGAEVVAGRAPDPNATDEAVVGRDLARTLGVGVGDTLPLGGSTESAVATVEVVGVFEAPGIADDHLLVSLPVARHLSGIGPRAVNIVRVDERPDAATGDPVVVLDVSAPTGVPAGREVTARVQLRNLGSERATRRVTVRLGDRERTVEATLDPDRTVARSVSFTPDEPGNYTLAVGDRRQQVSVVPPDALRVPNAPRSGPPGATLTLRVRTAAGDPAADATVGLGNRTVRTDSAGRATLALPDDPGTYTLAVRRGDRELTRSVRVAPDAPRAPAVSVAVPERTGVLTAPTVRVTLSNPWDAPLTREIGVRGPGTDTARTLRVPAGESRSVGVALERTAPGSHEVVVSANGSVVAERTYEVTGDARLGSALASSGRLQRGGGVDSLVERAFGNIGLLLGTLVVLGGLMTAGSTTAAFASAAQAHGRDIGVRRATGASPRRVLGAVLRDALRIALPATAVGTALALAARAALARAGFLTVFGVHLTTPVPLGTLAGLVGAALVLAVGSAAVVAGRFVLCDPARLLRSGGGR